MNRSGEIDFNEERQRMVREQLSEFPSVVRAAMEIVPRHEFVPPEDSFRAYADTALPIGHGQTISQPYIVALMTTRLEPKPTDRILEIGTGSGYQSAVLARLAAEIFTLEIVGPLARRANARLQRLGCRNVLVRLGDGSGGWPEAAPFDAVIVTCAPERIPPALTVQLKDAGRLIIPLGGLGDQRLLVYSKFKGGLVQQAEYPVRFVPMTGAARPARTK